MAALTVLTFSKRDALDALGLGDAEGLPICGTCSTEIEATNDEIAASGQAPVQTLFCSDGNQLWCGACVLDRSVGERASAAKALAVAQQRTAAIQRDIKALTDADAS